jgi:hypothetical protein
LSLASHIQVFLGQARVQAELIYLFFISAEQLAKGAMSGSMRNLPLWVLWLTHLGRAADM